MRSQGELQCHQAAAHRPIAGADEEAKDHTRGGLFHGFYEAPAQVTLDFLMVELGRFCQGITDHLSLAFVCETNAFLQAQWLFS